MLNAEHYKHHVDSFNAMDEEDVVNLIPNAQAWEWMMRNVPLLECPEEQIERTYYYRWWTFRKHIKETPAGMIITEFITPVKHAGPYNSISCALGMHIAEGRWLRERKYLDEYIRFWFRGGECGGPVAKFHNYSSWLASALWDRYLVDGHKEFLLELLEDLVADYKQWEAEKQLPNGMFWQYDVRDGMEESISGSRTHKNARPTINSYMFANANAIAQVARLANRRELADTYRGKATTLKQLVQENLWDTGARFFKAQANEGPLSDAREAIGFIPWSFDLPDANQGHEDAWAQLIDPQGFWAPMGITTAERRHPRFRSHGVGKCEWDGAVWPFATSQTLVALANVLRHYEQPHVTSRHFFEAMQTYARCHQKNGRPYIGEYHDEVTGEWLKGDNPRSRYYNHSTFCDLVIGGIVGLVPRSDDVVEVHPLLPDDAWDWFCLDRVPYRGRELTIAWDRTGAKYGKGAGLAIYADRTLVAQSPRLARAEGRLQ
jgi:hypothetical protein